MEINWGNRGFVTVEVDGRSLRLSGEVLLEHDPDFMIYERYLTKWDDGTPIEPDEKDSLVDKIVAEAARHGWKFQVQ